MESVRTGSHTVRLSRLREDKKSGAYQLLCSLRKLLQTLASLAHILKLVNKFLQTFQTTASVLCLGLSYLVCWFFHSLDSVSYCPPALLELIPAGF